MSGKNMTDKNKAIFTMRHPETLTPTVPASYVLLVLQILGERNVDTQALLAELMINDQHLTHPDARIELLTDYANLCRVGMDRASMPGLGYEFGLRSTVTTHGILGYGLMSQPRMRDVMVFASRYGATLRMPAWDLSFFEEHGQAVLRGTENVPHGDLREFSAQQLIISCYAVLRDLFPQVCRDAELCFDFPEPTCHAQYADRLPRCVFSRQFNEMRMPIHYVDLPLRTADCIAAQVAQQACERELALFGDAHRDIVRQVRALLRLGPQGYLDLDGAAAALAMSTRTLNRQLQARETSFRALLAEARYRDACTLLMDPRLDLTDVAVRLGYSSLGNFARAFREWKGCTPGEYRMLMNQQTHSAC